MLSKTSEVEQLMKEKSGLEDESRRLDEEQKKLSLRVRTLCEKLIQEMKKKNMEKQQSVGQLQVRIDNLQAQLDKLSVSAVSEEAHGGKIDVKEHAEAAEKPEDEEIDENVTVAEIEEEIELTSKQGGKKRKFF